MDLEQIVREAPEYRVVRRGETARETARNVYDKALEIAGLPSDEDQRDPLVMAIRAAGCLAALITATENVEYQVHEELGLIGGAAGAATFEDLQYLDAKKSLELFHITAARKELELMRPDLLMILKQVREQRAAA